MRRIRLTIAYDGTNYVGWQIQPNGVSVQSLLEKALYELTGETTRGEGSGRTDSGVHARAQVAHFDTDARMSADKYAIAMNMHLPPDIRVLYSEECDQEFHARFAYSIANSIHSRSVTIQDLLGIEIGIHNA